MDCRNSISSSSDSILDYSEHFSYPEKLQRTQALTIQRCHQPSRLRCEPVVVHAFLPNFTRLSVKLSFFSLFFSRHSHVPADAFISMMSTLRKIVRNIIFKKIPTSREYQISCCLEIDKNTHFVNFQQGEKFLVQWDKPPVQFNNQEKHPSGRGSSEAMWFFFLND